MTGEPEAVGLLASLEILQLSVINESVSFAVSAIVSGGLWVVVGGRAGASLPTPPARERACVYLFSLACTHTRP